MQTLQSDAEAKSLSKMREKAKTLCNDIIFCLFYFSMVPSDSRGCLTAFEPSRTPENEMQEFWGADYLSVDVTVGNKAYPLTYLQ